MAQKQPVDVIKDYLADVLAAEQHFEKQLRTFAGETDQPAVKQLFEQHADETRRQCERLENRLRALGGSPSGLKGFLANLFGFAPKTAQMGYTEAEKGTQDLVMAYAVENSEIAVYEALAIAAAEAGDTETERLAREIQQEERMAAQKIWDILPMAARDGYRRATMGEAAREAA